MSAYLRTRAIQSVRVEQLALAVGTTQHDISIKSSVLNEVISESGLGRCYDASDGGFKPGPDLPPSDLIVRRFTSARRVCVVVYRTIRARES